MQTVLVILILIGATCYGAWWVYNLVRQASDPCYGCKGCALKELKQVQKKKKADCWHKK
ncbi:FeoB-associated Cys-rich membrane protein [Prevotella sp. lc2012]|uniref:FeoB-associated Cys-rich membrane protein n=1 Tax=Prevotella sp. lc2012 TaxID=1761886 RepID=UPI00117C66AA|nr:FeoB-associated Cys-rich membrane protein [Prevotella sp. lc2012]